MDSYTAKQRKTIAGNHKNTDSLLLQINPNIFPAYSKQQKYKSAKPLTNRPKGKQNRKHKNSVKIQEFPQFAIKFKNEAFQPSKGNESFSSKQHPIQNLSQSFGRGKIGQRVLVKNLQNGNLNYKNNKQSINQHRSQKRKYLTNFTQAVERIFKSLDVFNRGRISETNINKWIPESALYFLGGVFQRIKQERLNLEYPQFQKLCRSLLFQSAEQDVKWFIEQVNGKETHLNVSIELESQQKCRQSSPVQMRVNHRGEKLKQQNIPNSNRKFAGKQPLEFDAILKNNKFKEMELNIRQNSVKEKHQSRNTPKNQVKQFSFYHNQNDKHQIQLKGDAVSFKQIKMQTSTKKKEVPAIVTSNNRCGVNRQKQEIQQIPNFTFQLPKAQSFNQESSKRENRFTRHRQQKLDLLGEFSNIALQPKTSRIVKQSVPKYLSGSTSRRSSSINPVQTDRIDKLSVRLQEYIKFNKQKLEENKKFIKENSTPRK